MASRSLEELGLEELLERLHEAEAQLESQETLQELITSLHTHQEELKCQHDALIAAQLELEASRDRFAELYDFAPVPILTLGPNGVIESMNLAAARLLGVDRAIAIGTPLIVYVHGASRREFMDHVMRARRGAGLVYSEIVVQSRNQHQIPVEIQSKSFRDQEEGPVVCHTVLVDLSERRRLEQERRKAADERERIQREELAARAASDAKDRFLAVLSHELRTPLTPILLTLEGLQDPGARASETQRGLALIQRNAEALTRLIDDLLDVTRIVHDKLKLDTAPVALHEVLSATVETCESELRAHGIELRLALEGEPAYVSGDAIRLRQIFLNLLRNAIHHTASGGQIEIRCEPLGAQALRVSVRDDGEGFDPDEAERLFEPFKQATRTSQPGSGLGLGLAICRGLAEAHGGSIHAISGGRGKGAIFVVELPSCEAPEAPPAESPGATPQRDPLRILVIEDHEDTADAMKVALGRLGHQVLLARTLEEARALAQQPFDVLISDVQLPDGSGLDLMRELSAQHPVKGIAMSGFGTESDVRRSREAGFHTHLVKPVDVHRVAEAIDALVRG